ncbi:MAG: nitroreductase family protein [Clostridiaceae bacterium]|nr:nitroreductase family protein [Clostridiaceae bacterium]
MTAFELMHTRRTVRKFTQQPVSCDQLLHCVEAARVAPSGANLQPLQYKLICDAQGCAALFPHLSWAGYLRPNGTPAEEERPTAYIVVVQNTDRRPVGAEFDAGAAIMSILLCAEEEGLEACWIASVDKDAAAKLYGFAENQRVLAVIALGYPAQQAVEVPMVDGNVRYYLDEDNRLNVPKRSMEDILL